MAHQHGHLNEQILRHLTIMLDDINPYFYVFQTAWEHLRETDWIAADHSEKLCPHEFFLENKVRVMGPYFYGCAIPIWGTPYAVAARGFWLVGRVWTSCCVHCRGQRLPLPVPHSPTLAC